MAPLRRSVRPPRADRELRAPRAPDLLRSCARGMAEARGLEAEEPDVPPEVLPSRFAFCSSTLRERDRNVVRSGHKQGRLDAGRMDGGSISYRNADQRIGEV